MVGVAARPWRRPAWLRWAALAAIMVAAVALRVMVPGVAEFKIDEVQPLALAEQIWLDHHLPLTRGLTSFGLPGTPFLGYLLVLPRAVSGDPRAAIVFMGLLGSLAVLVTYLGMRRFAGDVVALVAAALYAANPWAIFLTRKTWSEVLPLFTLLALWAACAVVIERRPKWALLFFLMLALQVQTHVLAVLYLPAALLTVVLYWPRWRHRYTLLGAALGALVLLPYALVLVRGWAATAAVLRAKVGQGPMFDLRALSFALWFASGKTLTALMGRSVAILCPWEQALRAWNVVTAGALVAGLVALLGAWWRRREAEYSALLLIWSIVPVVPMVLMPGEMGIHYLEIAVPMLFLLAAAGWVLLVGSRRRAVAFAGAAALAVGLAVQVGAVVSLYQGLTRYPTDGGFGRPLSTWLEVQRRVQARVAREGRPEVVVLGTDDAPWSSERAVVDYLLGRRVRLRYVGQGGRPGLLVPEQGDVPALVLGAGSDLAQALGRYGDEVERWPVPGSEWGVRLYRLRSRPGADLMREALLRSGARFENGMRLLGARVEGDARPGGRLLVTSYWTFCAEVKGAAGADMVFNHLLGAGDRRWAQYDGFAWSRAEWQPGYTLLQWFDLSLPAEMPAGEYWLYTGMYSWRDMSRARVLDEAGQPGADGVRLGPIPIRPANDLSRVPGGARSPRASQPPRSAGASSLEWAGHGGWAERAAAS